jgi:hypothetical protein
MLQREASGRREAGVSGFDRREFSQNKLDLQN